jgi:hypothetical protein
LDKLNCRNQLYEAIRIDPTEHRAILSRGNDTKAAPHNHGWWSVVQSSNRAKVVDERERGIVAKATHPDGYSGTPLWKKLGFKPDMKVCVLNAPPHYAKLIDGPNDWIVVEKAKAADALHLFTTDKSELKGIGDLAEHMPPAIMLWVSWPKKTSPLSKGMSEDDIRASALACGLVDIKVCAVDKDWSGLKLTRQRA